MSDTGGSMQFEYDPERLIQEVKKREGIWNYNHPNYKIMAARVEMWNDVVQELLQPNIKVTKYEMRELAKDCKNKWNLLRNAFMHAMARRKTVSGQGVKNFKKWKYEDEMAFLLPYMTNRNSIAAQGEFSHDTADSPNEETSSSTSSARRSPLLDIAGYSILCSPHLTDPNEETNENNSHQKNRQQNNYHEDMLNLLKERTQKKSEKNDIDLFFSSIAETVKKFPKVEQVKIKFQIMQMVNEIEMKICLENDAASTSTYISTP